MSTDTGENTNSTRLANAASAHIHELPKQFNSQTPYTEQQSQVMEYQ